MRKRRRIDIARASHTKTVIPDTEIENRAIVIGVCVEQGDEGITIAQGIVQSLHRDFQPTCRKRAIGTQRIPQLTCITGVGVE